MKEMILIKKTESWKIDCFFGVYSNSSFFFVFAETELANLVCK